MSKQQKKQQQRIVSTSQDGSFAVDVGLLAGYYKRGDDLQAHVEHHGGVLAGLKAWADSLDRAAQDLRSVVSVLEQAKVPVLNLTVEAGSHFAQLHGAGSPAQARKVKRGIERALDAATVNGYETHDQLVLHRDALAAALIKAVGRDGVAAAMAAVGVEVDLDAGTCRSK